MGSSASGRVVAEVRKPHVGSVELSTALGERDDVVNRAGPAGAGWQGLVDVPLADPAVRLLGVHALSELSPLAVCAGMASW